MHAGVLQWFTRQASEVENGMTCVEVSERGLDRWGYEIQARSGSAVDQD